MFELTGIASLLRGIGFLYWMLAVGLLVLALWKGVGWKGKTLWALPVIAIFCYLPTTAYLEQQKREAYAKDAWAYFKNLCDTKSGEKIYKTFTGVKSVLVLKPLPPASGKDLYDQYWYGDPYSNATPSEERGTYQAGILLRESLRQSVPPKKQIGFQFVELTLQLAPSVKYQRIVLSKAADGRVASKLDDIPQPQSRFGISWEDISKPEDRKYWVAGSRLRVIDLVDNSVIAERIGYFIEAGFGSGGQRRPWLAGRGPRTTCPPVHGGDYEDQWFITSVLSPSAEK